jgi:hypothetical protein
MDQQTAKCLMSAFHPVDFSALDMVKLTEAREITPYRWTHPDDGDRSA